MKKIKAVALVLIMILCGAAFARGMQVEAKANAVQEKLSGEVFRLPTVTAKKTRNLR